MTRDELKNALRQPYDRQRWAACLGDWLPAVEWFARPQLLPDRPDGVENIHQLGKVTLANRRALAVLEVRLGEGKDLLRNRVGLRKLIVKYIDQQVSHGVIAVFVSDASEYRLTLAVRESVIGDDGEFAQRETAPRRYTFVLGPDEACTTAAGRLHALAEKATSATLADVVEAFSVERLNDEFFKRYKEHYQRFVDYLLQGDLPQRVFGIARSNDAGEYERALKPVRDFAKKLLGRLVFLHFLQKKGWLGCPPGKKDWHGGDANFLANLFKNTPTKDRFFSQRLVPLFFEALNRRDRAGDQFAPTGTRVPYLNGGLFEEDLPAARKLDFPAALFGGVLDFFGEYNFTIDENDPEDHEIGIDPEMLGHVFENLLEDNKERGIYYTPKAIVQYMCQQSLIHYLQTHLGERAEIATLVRDKDPGEASDKNNWTRRNAKEIERLLDDVKICDPAIGSGAFPIGLLQEIYWIKLALDWTLDRAETKRRIIQNSIYGVDIDAGAVEIARLRFWLALIVEEDQPSPLPNLDYKIMQGDSLLESFEGIPLDHLFSHDYSVKMFAGQGALDLNSPGTQMTLVEKHHEDLVKLTRRYFAETDPAAKHALHGRIDALVLRHIDDSIQEQTQRFELELAQHQAQIKDKQRRAKGWKPPARTVKRMAALEKELRLCAERGEKLKTLQDKQERPFFLWHLYFQDVFARGGFDIVIANPPYVSSEKFSGTSMQAAWKRDYRTYASRVDIYCLFYERGLGLLREQGLLCFISSNKFLRADYGKNLRTLLKSESCLGTLIDFGELPVFAAATDPAIVVAERSVAPEGHELTAATIKDEAELEHLRMAVAQRALKVPQGDLRDEGWSLESGEGAALIARMRERGVSLAEFVKEQIYYGIKTGLNEAFVIDAATRARLIEHDPGSAELIKPWLQGHEIRRWHHKWAGMYLIAVRYGFHAELKRYPAILKHLTRYEKRLRNRGQCRTSRGGGAEGQHHWLELDNNPSAAYLKAFEGPKIVFNETSKRLHAFVDEESFYVNKTGFIILTPEPYYLLAVLNSRLLDFLYRSEFPSWGDPWKGGRVQFRGSRMKQVPIPVATERQRKALADLARAASRVAGSDLLDVERKIDRQVYALFGLSDADISFVESRTPVSEPILDAKTALTTRVLPELARADAYFSHAAVVERLADLDIELPADTLRSYLSEAMNANVIHDAGRGWYSRLPQPLVLDGKPIAPLVRLIKKEFPLLDFSCWSTAQINPWAQHLLATHTAFLHAEADALPSLAERLAERGWKAYVNPTPSEARSRFRPADKSVVLRPALSKQPEAGDHAAPVEKVLVDLIFEAPRLQLMDDTEAQQVVANAVQAGRAPVAALLAYAQRRRVEVAYFNQSINSTSGENVDLMDSA
ncbi:MAG: Eco57I restriction-modification methylase domain-containing protein [Proteobacteria bacterium]|nr:Eco57I restriction-modification methylase domain-containing protein [Pseudomonadota bacterium]